jgi:hypothetical protein
VKVSKSQIEKKNVVLYILAKIYSLLIMAIPVIEFQVRGKVIRGYKIRKIFAEKSTKPEEIIEFCELV